MRNGIRIVWMFLLFVLSMCAEEAALCMEINALIATRESKISTYAEINKEEIYLVLAQLAKAVSPENVEEIGRIIQEKDFGDSPDIIKEQVLSVFNSGHEQIGITSDKPTLVLFNEMFFGRDRALERGVVDFIISCYRDFSRFLKNTYLCIDLLYKDSLCEKYNEQVSVSKARYEQICNLEAKNEQFCGFSSIWFQMGLPPNYTSLNKWYLDLVSSKEVTGDVFSCLLFNQVKIFFEGEEIGFYNKSSFCAESLPDFIGNISKKEVPVCNVEGFCVQGKVPFYVIGDFNIHWIKDHNPVLDDITSLICYDTDAILNLDKQPPQKQICLFTSNTYNTLLASIIDRKNKGVFDHIYVCSDPKGTMLSKNIEKDEDICDFEIMGAFETADITFFPLKNIPPLGGFEFKFPPRGRTMNNYKICSFKL